MWEVRNTKKNNGWKEYLIAFIACIIFLIGTIMLCIYVVKFFSGAYPLDYAFLKCMAVFGVWFILYAILGSVLRKIS